MKINGGGQPPVPGANGVDASPRAEGLGETGAAVGPDKSGTTGKTFAETVGGPGPTRAAEVAGDPAVRALAAEVDAGKLDAHAAVDRLIEHVIDLQLGAGASPQAREQIGAALREAVASDPLIAEKLKQLG